MAKSFDTIAGLMSYIQKAAQEVAKTNVADAIIDENIKFNESEIYSYNQKEYTRRNTLTDKNNFVVDDIGDNTIEIYNNAEPNTPIGKGSVDGWQVSLMVEEGRVSDMFGEGFWTGDRPATAKTVESLESSGKHTKAMIQGLKKFGIEAK